MKYLKTHINQINKDQTQTANIESSKGKTKNNTQGDSDKDNGYLSIETPQARREWQDILKSDEREKPTTQVTVPSKDLIQI